MRPKHFKSEIRGPIAKSTPGSPYQRYGIPMVLPLDTRIPIQSIIFTTFTGINMCVNLLAGKTLGFGKCLFWDSESLNMTRRLKHGLGELFLPSHVREILDQRGILNFNLKKGRNS